MTENFAYDYIMNLANTDKVEAGELMVRSLMASDKATLKLGYTFPNALNATAELLKLSQIQLCMLADRFVPKDEK